MTAVGGKEFCVGLLSLNVNNSFDCSKSWGCGVEVGVYRVTDWPNDIIYY